MIVLCLVCAAPVQATQGDMAVEKQKSAALDFYGKGFIPLARGFQCGVLARADYLPSGNVAIFNYLPESTEEEEHTLDSWSRMVEIYVYPLPADTAAAGMTLRKLMGGLLKNYRENVKMIKSEFMARGLTGEPASYLEFEIGEPPLKEHAAGAFFRASAKYAIFVQVLVRGTGKLTDEDREMLYTLLGRKDK